MIITILVLAVSGFILLTGSSDESKKPIVKVGGYLDDRSYFRSRCHRIVVLGATGLLRLSKNKTPSFQNRTIRVSYPHPTEGNIMKTK